MNHPSKANQKIVSQIDRLLKENEMLWALLEKWQLQKAMSWVREHEQIDTEDQE